MEDGTDGGSITPRSGSTGEPGIDRDALVLEFMWVADRCAAGYTGRGEHYDDLKQVAVIGLIKAAQRFDPDRGVPFEAFAVPTIKGELRHHFRDLGWGVKVPERIKDVRSELHNAIARLEQRLGRSPTPDEVARDLRIDAAVLEAALHADNVYVVESLDAITARRGDEASDESLTDVTTDVFGSTTSRVDALHALRCLNDRERAIVYWRFFEDRTQQEIAERLGIGQAHVSRLLGDALRHLATRLGLAARASTTPDESTTLHTA